jgi:aldose 1-epimerase
MSFSIDIQSISTFKLVRITNLSTSVYIDILSKGGLLNSWMQAAENWDIIDGNDLSNGWMNYEANGFKSAKMNPFACRLYNGEFMHLEKSYKITQFYLGGHALHGILYNAEYDIIATKIEEDCAKVVLEYHYRGTDKGFPFEYTTHITWTFFANNKISVQTTIINNSKETIPMVDGWHPYFKLGERIDNCHLQFKCKGLLAYDAALIPTGKITPNNLFEKATLLENIKLDNGYLLDTNEIEKAQCILENDKYILIVKPSDAYPYLQLYTPDHRKSIAIENLSGAPDCFNNKMGLHIMQPQSIWNLATSYQLITK